MSQVYSLQISFPGIDLDSFSIGHTKIDSSHHAHLSCAENEIEIKIFYDPKTMFGHKLSHWASSIKWNNFGAFINIKCEKTAHLQNIDLSQSSLMKIVTGSNQYENGKQFIRILVDSVKFYWNPHFEHINTGEFYLNDQGFEIVKGYYAVLFGDGEEFEISRMNGLSDYYTLEGAQYRPEFNFWINDSRNSNEAKIVKEPKIQFNYNKEISEPVALKYAEVVCLIASFFFRSKFYYILSRIHLREHTIVIKRIQLNKERIEHSGHLWDFGCELNFDLFMKTNWQLSALTNFSKLEKAIQMFIQAISVDNSSRFLLLYNIIEVCMSGTKASAEKFETIVDEPTLEKKYDEALNILLQTIKPADYHSFSNKWKPLKDKLMYKPMKSPLNEFLRDEGFNLSVFPISPNDLKDIRDKITHGTVNGINTKTLADANILLYRIAGILILNILGIKEWTLKTELPG